MLDGFSKVVAQADAQGQYLSTGQLDALANGVIALVDSFLSHFASSVSTVLMAFLIYSFDDIAHLGFASP